MELMNNKHDRNVNVSVASSIEYSTKLAVKYLKYLDQGKYDKIKPLCPEIPPAVLFKIFPEMVTESYPNMLLMKSQAKKAGIKAEPEIDIETGPETENETIFDIIDQMQNDISTDSIDNIRTDSETAVDSTETDTDTDTPVLHTCAGCHTQGSLVEDSTSGVIVCNTCGMVNEELLDYGPEWRQYEDSNSRESASRCNCPNNYFFPKSSQGTIMAGATSIRLKRRQKWNSMIYKERSLNDVFDIITTICSNNNIPKIIVDTAKILYKTINDCKHQTGANTGKQIIIRGMNRTSIIAACVFKACEMNKSPRTLREIALFFDLAEKKITKGIKQFEKIMNSAADSSMLFDRFEENTSTEDYIRRLCPKLRLNKLRTEMSVTIANNCCKMKLASDHNPQSIAAGAIMAMVTYCDLNVEKKDIAKMFSTSDVTINKICKKIGPYIDALVDNDATDHIIKKFKING